ncbi:MAG: Hsp20/alpha crystallin family protein [Bacteroidales bacterium]
MVLLRKSERNAPSMPGLFERFFNDDLMDFNLSNFAGSDSNIPAVNVKENDNEYQIEVAAPGLKKDDFRISVENDRLTISSEKEDEKKEKDDENFTRREFRYQSFQRSFHLPENMVDTEKIKANYNNGILSIKVPKREEAKPKPAREIKIS